MTMPERVKARFDQHPERVIADTAYGTGLLLGRLVEREIALHISVIDKSGHANETWSRVEFT